MQACSTFGLALAGLLLASGVGAVPEEPKTAVPVVVELFTSQGCSSCPPADALLAELAATQPVPGARVIPLSQHVDYWNSLGWKDPYSTPAATRRQRLYASYFRADRVYTPQMVVAGRSELVGNRRSATLAAIAAAVPRQTVRVAIRVESDGSAGYRIAGDLRGSGTRQAPANVMLALTGWGSNDVEAGENVGRHLTHVGVVQRLEILDRVPGVADKPEGARERAADGVTVHAAIPAEALPAGGRIDAVLFVQLQATGEIVGAASAPLR